MTLSLCLFVHNLIIRFMEDIIIYFLFCKIIMLSNFSEFFSVTTKCWTPPWEGLLFSWLTFIVRLMLFTVSLGPWRSSSSSSSVSSQPGVLYFVVALDPAIFILDFLKHFLRIASFMCLIYNLKEKYLSNQVLWGYLGPELGLYLRCWLLVWKWRLSVNFKLNWFCIISTLISKFLVCWVKSALQFLGSFLDFNFSCESEVLLRKSYIIPGTKKLPETQQWHWWQSAQIPTPTPVWRWADREAIGAKLGINGSVSVCKQLL